MKKTLLLWLFGLLLTAQVFAQNRTLSGTVKDTKGEPLIGVNVTAKGTTLGTVTDVDGKYTFEVPKEATTLEFSYVGYTTVEKTITALVADVTMSEEVTKNVIDEVVVTAVAVQRPVRTTSFNATTLKADDLQQSAGTALTALQGKAAGVRVSQNGGQLGSSSRIVLRGEVSLTGNNNALIVVDGIPINNRTSTDDNQFLTSYVDYGNRANDINPDDIETMTILRGPAATALYGSRAASGVVLITTKKGAQAAKEGKKVKASFSTGLTFDKAYVLLKRQNQFGEGVDGKIVFGENFSWGPKVDGVVRPWTNPFEDENGNTVMLYKPYNAIKNQIQDFFDIGITNTNSFALEGGSDNFNYRVSYTNLNNKGIVPYTGYKRHNVSFAAEAKFADNVSSNFTLAYTKSNFKTIASGSEFYNPLQSILQTPIDIPLSELRDYNNPFYGFKGYYGSYTPNPYYVLANESQTASSDNILGQVTIDYKPVKGLSLVSRIGDNFTNSFIQAKSPKFTYENNELNVDGAESVHSDGRYYESIEKSNDLNVDIYANYKNDFGKKKKFNFSVLGGFNYVDRSTTIITAKTNGGLGFPGVYDIKNSVAAPLVEDNKVQTRLAGVYANLLLGYRNAIFFEYSARNDWSSTLPKDNRGFFYQSGGISAVVSEFIKPNKWLSFLKLRANAGSVGKDARFGDVNTPVSINPDFDDFSIPDYKYQFPISIGNVNYSGLTINNAAGNDKIKPEITTTYEGGVDIGLFQDKLTIEATGYYQLSKNQIVATSVAPSSGFTSALFNVGKISNKGVELTVKATPIKNLKGVTWSIYYNYAMNRSKVLKVSDERDELVVGGTTAMAIVAKEGLPFGTFKGNAYQRDSLGRIMLSFTSGYPIVSTKQEYFGSYIPKYTMGFGTTLSWRGLSASVSFDLRQGGVFYSTTKDQGQFNGTTLSSVINNRQPFIIPNSSYIDPLTTQLVANTTVATSPDALYFSALPESTNLIDASYIKLREVTLSYSLPSKAFGKSPISNMSIGFVARNLKTWLPAENTYTDPELGGYGTTTNVQGFESATAPFARSYGFELKVGF